MIVEKTMRGCQCDNCKGMFEDYDNHTYWADLEVLDVMDDSDWHTVETKDVETDKHYCPNCYKIDDEDNLIVNSERTKP